MKSLWIVPLLLQHFKSRWLLVVAATLLRHMPKQALLACMGIPISPSSMAYSGHIVYITLEREFVRAKCCIHSPVQSIVQLVARVIRRGYERPMRRIVRLLLQHFKSCWLLVMAANLYVICPCELCWLLAWTYPYHPQVWPIRVILLQHTRT